jgi:S-adenosylmethionine-diacylglycerol 3-amino-3-carboxypropyl transferase
MSMETFFQQIVYSAANEDPDSERQALALTGDDTVLCITGSGARPLDLLLDSPGEIVSVDFNVRQNHLLELKMAAIAGLTHRECLQFLGVHPSPDRSALLAAISSRLTPEAHAYWQGESTAIRRGVLYMGVWERYMQLVKGLLPRRRLLRRVLTADSLEVQRELWQRWRSWMWLAGMRMLGWRWVWRWILREPGIAFVPPDYPISQHLIDSFDRAASDRLLVSNPYFNLMVGDGYTDAALPLHLQQEHFETLRSNLGRIRIVNDSLLGHLQQTTEAYTAFSLSDFSSYADPAMYRDVWEAVIGAGKDGARVCERFFMVHYEPEELFPGVIVRNPELEHRLQQQDHTFIYSFNCATLNKGAAAT